MPARGRIGIFNRSYYEEVLIARVHPEIVTHGQRLPAEFTQDLDLLWNQRYETIRAMEQSHHRNGTRIHKFFLHLSRDEQRKRFLSRLDSPSKNWKFNEGDLKERKLWDRYMEAYEAAMQATSTPESPWHIIPADDKATARLLIATIVRDALKALPMSFPTLTDEQLANLGSYRKLLEKGD
jgi:polyphosphate kinase 2 (PPK2 family)